MFFLAGAAASSALDLITTLQQTVSAKASATPAVQAFDPAADSAAASAGATTANTPNAPIAPGTMNALLAVQGHPGLVNGDAFSSQLFSLLDSDGDGAISKSEFESVFGQDGNTARADGIFAQLDADSDGAISQNELTSALRKSAHQHHGHHHSLSGAGEVLADGGINGACPLARTIRSHRAPARP